MEAEEAEKLKASGTTLEKVERALSICSEWVRDESGQQKKDCWRCPYWDDLDPAGINCGERMMKDAGEVIRQMKENNGKEG